MRPMEFHRVWHLQQQALRAHIFRRHARIVVTDADDIDLITLRRKKRVEVQASSSEPTSIPVYFTDNRRSATEVSGHAGIGEERMSSVEREDDKVEPPHFGTHPAEAKVNGISNDKEVTIEASGEQKSGQAYNTAEENDLEDGRNKERIVDTFTRDQLVRAKADGEAKLLEGVTAESLRANYKQARTQPVVECSSSNSPDSLRQDISKKLTEENKQQNSLGRGAGETTDPTLSDLFSAHNQRVAERLKTIASRENLLDTASISDGEVENPSTTTGPSTSQRSEYSQQFNQSASSLSTYPEPGTLLPIPRDYLLQNKISKWRFSSRLATRPKPLTEILGQINLANLTTPPKGWELVDAIDDALLFTKAPKRRKWPWVSAGVLIGCVGYLVSTV